MKTTFLFDIMFSNIFSTVGTVLSGIPIAKLTDIKILIIFIIVELVYDNKMLKGSIPCSFSRSSDSSENF